MNIFIITLTAISLSLIMPPANAEKPNLSKPNYVGGGRYTCYEKTAECALIKQNNRRITQEEIERRDRKRDSRFSARGERSTKPMRKSRDYDPRSYSNH